MTIPVIKDKKDTWGHQVILLGSAQKLGTEARLSHQTLIQEWSLPRIFEQWRQAAFCFMDLWDSAMQSGSPVGMMGCAF